MNDTATCLLDSVICDATGLPSPRMPQALREGGAAFLTEAFRAFGSLAPDNSVPRIVRLRSLPRRRHRREVLH